MKLEPLNIVDDRTYEKKKADGDLQPHELRGDEIVKACPQCGVRVLHHCWHSGEVCSEEMTVGEANCLQDKYVLNSLDEICEDFESNYRGAELRTFVARFAEILFGDAEIKSDWRERLQSGMPPLHTDDARAMWLFFTGEMIVDRQRCRECHGDGVIKHSSRGLGGGGSTACPTCSGKGFIKETAG